MKLLFLFFINFISISVNAQDKYTDTLSTFNQANDAQKQALTVLVKKCNVCHATKKRQTVFTIDNMDSLSDIIYYQVFEKKKMPKGRKIKLTQAEEGQLKTWLSSLN